MNHHLTLRINPGERVGIAADELPLLDENGSVIAACWQMGEDFDGENDDENMEAKAAMLDGELPLNTKRAYDVIES